MQETIFTQEDWDNTYTQEEKVYLETRYKNKLNNAERRGKLFTIDMDDMYMLGKKLLGEGACDYSGLPLSRDGDSSPEKNPMYPTFERVDNNGGYVRGNICVVGNRANKIKDWILDREAAVSITDFEDRAILKGMMLHLSENSINELKEKYIPRKVNYNTRYSIHRPFYAAHYFHLI